MNISFHLELKSSDKLTLIAIKNGGLKPLFTKNGGLEPCH
jgi:hypothetical protein